MSTAERDSKQGGGQEDERFISRWSRRKQEAGQLEDHSDAGKLEGQTEQPTGADETLESPPLTDADMPAVESLDAESDFRGFLSPGVSEQLRRIALRKLFHSAEFNVRDGLDDYDDDFTQFTKLGELITADMKYQWEREADLAKEKASPGDSEEEVDQETVAAAEPEQMKEESGTAPETDGLTEVSPGFPVRQTGGPSETS
ncbi:MAG: DUF3306 domain-containing protein [Gammaproteobacteria bacterium]|nr:DUF3306 domain-containing protein [Gammaproteobacteria bacterium]